MNMENLIIIGTIVLVHFFAVITPGPDFIMAIKNSLSYSRKIGIWTSVGFGLGISVHAFYSLAGVAVIVSQSILIFNTIKLLGAAYLIYIGYKSITSKNSKIEISKSKNKKEITKFQAIKMGFFTNVLNPKVTLFFLSLFTLIVSPDTSKLVLGIASLIMVINTILWFSLVSIFFTHEKIRKSFEKFQGVFNKIFGTLLIALGIKIALIEK